ncbi:anaerobic sulfatase maturase [Enterovibrio sp. ZSDZ35]|uniref:Anaerobic sulfatase maturase n=1 Tax=Enterovibrio qingdaonensis TaxID=2899818 RepID=A0ABT5QIW5_9GAMM|nr:anaerobic sulfatase maturase [Enterovibrio sp. ZSDZ35]MDD1780799.1 anaerobic sulfatase maturase [Enterovibrio sp. ZSDZ35]
MLTSVPYSLSIKPVSATCNLNCSYCYYLENTAGCSTAMDLEILDTAIANHMASQPASARYIDFIWHGGEPLLRGRAFYLHAFEQQRRLAGGRQVINTFQTNGTLINHQWASLFKEHDVMVGVSIDGPQLLNDIARIDRKGRSSFEKTLRGIALLNAHHVEFNTLTVINNRTYRHGAKIYRFLKEHGSGYMQFQPCIDHELDRRSDYDWSLTGKQWGLFLCDVFDAWCEKDVGSVYIQFFENCLMVLMGHASQMCHHSEQCGQQLMMEADGHVFSCDHFGYENHCLGNVHESPIAQLVSSEQQRAFGESKKTLPDCCSQCDFLPLCHGGCPKNRTDKTSSGEALNALCDGYKQFFTYALPRLLKMVDAMQNGYSPKYHVLF